MSISSAFPGDACEVHIGIGIADVYIEALASAEGRQRSHRWHGGNLEDCQCEVATCLLAAGYAPSGPRQFGDGEIPGFSTGALYVS